MEVQCRGTRDYAGRSGPFAKSRASHSRGFICRSGPAGHPDRPQERLCGHGGAGKNQYIGKSGGLIYAYPLRLLRSAASLRRRDALPAGDAGKAGGGRLPGSVSILPFHIGGESHRFSLDVLAQTALHKNEQIYTCESL